MDDAKPLYKIFIPASFRDRVLRQLNGSELQVYVAYASRAGTDGLAWPSIECLCIDCNISSGTAKKARKKLQELGLLEFVEYKRMADGEFSSAVFRVRCEF